ncbi:MAG: fluoride efflux transporter CrcB [Myxococcota bacterium]
MNLQSWLLVGVGGALGSMLRYGVGLALAGVSHFPLATLLVNVLGSMLIVGVHEKVGAGVWSPELRLLLATGVMGGFTTYSTFNYDVLMSLSRGAYGQAALNVLLTLGGCLMGASLISSKFF